ncbi:hypothetical protein DFH28DRAFT_1131780 [Melampsora americana]|nr:hypothetical protein DFH28DRAFT_1131780 [Melampsora americana]
MADDSSHPYTDPYIYATSDDPADPQLRCSACNSRTLSDYPTHIKTPAHHLAVQRLLAQQDADEVMLQAIRSTRGQSIETRPDYLFEHDLDQTGFPRPDLPERPLTPLSYLREIHGTDVGDDFSDESGDELDFQMLREALEAMANPMDQPNEDHLPPEMDFDGDLEQADGSNTNGWYPFTKKEHIVALLIIGSTRSLLSRLQYQRIRSILRICDVNLPAWGSLRDLSNRTKRKMGLAILARHSPTGKPLFGLKELANPMVSPHLAFLPELPVNIPVNRLSQCEKWREGYSKDLRVQMLVSKGIHFYIYQPVQVATGQLVVPIFFYKQEELTIAKCLPAVVEPASGNQQGYRIILEEEPPFDSPELLTIEVTSFWRLFEAVELDNGERLRDVCGDLMYQRTTRGIQHLPMVNPWRTKSEGKIIRHVPLTLYSDDTSGNISKKFNKHISIYFTLSGLPPDWSNQEYNTHFLATTNSATALELFDQVVDEINELGRNGFTTYDHSLGTEVCAMVMVLCHLGDSPMHAKICNTTNPANTLTPCRMCNLKVDRQVEKKEDAYVRKFLGLDENGEKAPLPNRNWNITRERTVEIWQAAQMRNSKKLVEDLGRQYGLRDTLNDHFIELVQTAHVKLTDAQVHALSAKLDLEWGNRLFNPMLRLEGFNGHLDTPVEILHVVLLGVVKYLYRDTMKAIKPGKTGAIKYNDMSARWCSFNYKGLNIPPILPHTLIQFFQSLVGKEFRTVLQTVPFVLYEHVNADVRHLWTALCLLGSYVFQTEISSVDIYMKELDTHVDLFLSHLMSMTAQWVNKPKFHMLTHLKHSIQRFGPPALVATEKFESFNGKTRDASVHSNRQSPGNDIANTFLTAQMMRILLSATSFFDHDLQARVVAGDKVQSLWFQIPELAQAMGLNMAVANTPIFTDSVQANQRFLPLCLEVVASRVELEELSSVTLPSKQKVEPNDFVVIKHDLIVGQVASIWKPVDELSSKVILVLAKCNKGPIVPFYGMREFITSDRIFPCDIMQVESLVNMQHNCHGTICAVTSTQTKKIERHETKISVPTIKHSPTRSFILNTASHYSAELHRRLAEIQVEDIRPGQWNEAIEKGLAVWAAIPRPIQKTKKKAADPVSPS